MTSRDDEKRNSLDSLGEQLNKAINYHVMEYKLTYDEVIGCLEIIKLGMYDELKGRDDE